MPIDAESKTLIAPGEPARPDARPRFLTPQLRIHDGQVFVGFGSTPLSEGVVLSDLALIAPDVTFPFDIAGSAATRYQKKKCRFGYLELELDADHFHDALQRVQQGCADHVASLRLHLRGRDLEGEGRLHAASGAPAPFTFRIGFQPEGTRVLAYVYDLRLYGPALSPPAPYLAALLVRAALRAPAIPEASAEGAVGLSFDPVPGLLRRAVPLRGFRLPETGDARLARVDAEGTRFRIRFEAGARPDLHLDEALLSCVEGTRSFEEGEEALARGDLAAAEAFYLRLGELSDAHPFAQERLLGLLAARPQAHDLALDLARSLRRAHPGASAGLWVEAGIRLARGETKEAGELYAQLGRVARDKGEDASAFHALAAAGQALLEPSPAVASRCLQEALALRPDDLACLTALARAADYAGEVEGAMRAYRRIAALARDPAQAARAHVRLGETLLRVNRDRAAARLHLDAALRTAPTEPEALLAMAQLCRLDGEHLRAIRCLDQLVEAARERADTALEARAHLSAGLAWEEGLGHLANALHRVREAARLEPTDPQPALEVARILERMERHAEALESYQAVVVLAEGKALDPARRACAHAAHRALAKIAQVRLDDPQIARRHYEAALALDPDDLEAMRALLPAFRETGRWADLARACERCAPHFPPAQRAELLVEAAELLVTRLQDPTRAERLLEQALLVDPSSRRALSLLADRVEARGDGRALCRLLLRLVECAPSRDERLALLRRLAAAADGVAGDLDLAADALKRALALHPGDLELQAALCEVQRRRGDQSGLCDALGDHAGLLEAEGEFAAAAAALRERALLLEERFRRPGEALDLLEHALALAPDNRDVLRTLGDLSLRHQRYAPARQTYRSLLAAVPPGTPEAAEAQALLGRACDALGDRAGAIEALRSAFALRPGDDLLAERLLTLLREGGHERERARIHHARGDAKRTAGLLSEAAREFHAEAEVLAAVGDAAGRRAALESALACEPDGPHALACLEALAGMALTERDVARAAELIARQAPFHAEGRRGARTLYHAAVLLKESAPARFRELLIAAARRDGFYPPARASLAYLRFSEREYADALAHADAALSVEGDADGLAPRDQVELHRLAARAARELGELDPGRRHLRAWCDAFPDDAEALEELAALHRQAGASADLAHTLGQLASKRTGAPAAEALRERAEVLAGLPGRRFDALQAFRSALELEPGSLSALKGLARLLDQPADAPERAQLLARVAAATSDRTEGYRLLLECARSHLESGNPAEAVRAFERAAALTTDPVDVLERLREAAVAAGDEARELEAQARRAAIAAERHELDAADRHLALGLRLSRAARAEEALRALGAATELQPTPEVHRQALTALIGLLEVRGENAEAAERLGQLAPLLQGPERAAALLRRSEILEASGAKRAARDALTQALAATPGDRKALEGLRRLCAALGDVAGQVEALEALLALPHPDRREGAQLALELGELLLHRLDEPERAEEALRRALALDRTLLPASRQLFDVLVRRGHLEEALPLGEKLGRSLGGTEGARWFLELAALAGDGQGDRALALRFARLAHEADASFVPAISRLADALYAAGARREALPLYRRLALAAPSPLDAVATRQARLRFAELAEGGQERAEACQVLQAILDEEPTCAPAADLLFEALLGSDPEQAVIALARHARALPQGTRALALFTRLSDVARTRLAAPSMAAEFLEAARALSGEDTLGIDLALADARREAGDPVGLAQALRRAAARAAQLGDGARALPALDELASVLERQGDRAGCAAVLAQAAELRAAGGQAREAAALLHRSGDLLRAGDLDLRAAEAAFRRAFALDPNDRLAAEQAAALCRLRGDTSGEAELLEACVHLVPAGEERALALLRVGQLRLDAGETARARGFLEQALAQRAELKPARDLLEQILGLEGRHAELARSLESRADLASSPAERLELLKRAAHLWRSALGSPQEASRLLLAAHLLEPDDLTLSDECAALLFEAGRTEQSSALDAELLARAPAHPRAFGRRRVCLQKIGDATGEAALLETRAAHEPPATGASLLLEAAALRARLDQTSAAADDERRAFELDPSNPHAFGARVKRASEEGPEVLAELLRRRAEAVPAEAFALHRARGQALAEAGAIEAAAAALDQALAVDPSDPEALALRGDMAERLDGPASAERFDRPLLEVTEAGAHVPRVHQARASYRLGLALLERDAERALELLETALALEPKDERAPLALNALASLYERAGDSAALHRVLVSLADRATDAGAKAAALRRALACAPDAGAELQMLEQLASLVADDGALLQQLAKALGAAGRHAEQLEALERAAPLEGEPLARARVLLQAASAADRLANVSRARDLRANALRAAPRDLAVLKAVLPDLREGTDEPALAAALAAAAEQTPDAEEAGALLLERAQVLEATGERAIAADAWLAAARCDPPDAGLVEAALAASQLLAGLGRLAHASELLERAAERAEGAKASALSIEAARLSTQEGDRVRARALLEKAVLRDETSPAPHAALAGLFASQGLESERASALLQQARRSEAPLRADLFLEAGHALEALGRAEGAAAAYAEALEHEPRCRAARLALAESCERRGEPREALRHVEALLAEDEPAPAERMAWERRAARLAEAAGAADAARLHWERLFDLDPGDADAFARARALLAPDAHGERLVLLARHDAAVREREPRAPERLGLLCEQARLLLELKRPEQAEALYREARALDPTCREALQALREAAAARGDAGAVCDLLEAEVLVAAPSEQLDLLVAFGTAASQQLHDERRAASAFERAAARAKEARDANRLFTVEQLLVRSLVACGEDRRALELLEGRLEAGDAPEGRVLRELAADAALRLGERDRAMRHLLAALQREPTSAELLGRIEELGAGSSPAELAQALSARADAMAPGPERSALLLRVADARRATGERAAERAALERALADDSTRVDTFERLCSLLDETGDQRGLVALLQARAAGTPEPQGRAGLLCRAGDLLRGALNEPSEAAAVYAQALEAAPLARQAVEGFAQAWFASSRQEPEAVHHHLAAGTASAALPFVAERLAELAEGAGRTREALAHYRVASRRDPPEPALLRGLLRAAEAAGEREEALGACLALLDASPTAPDRTELHAKAGEWLLAARRLDEAEAQLQRAGAAGLPHLRTLAQLRGDAGDSIGAAEALLRLAEGLPAGPERTAGWRDASDLFAGAGVPERALAALERGLEESPDDVELLTRRCAQAARLGDSAALVRCADRLEAAGASERLAPLQLELGRSLCVQGREEQGLQTLRAVLAASWSVELAREVTAVAERLARPTLVAEVEERLAGALATSQPEEAAARLRRLAQAFEEAQPARAADLLARASAIEFSEADLERRAQLLQRAPETAPDAVKLFAELARRLPCALDRQQKLAAAAASAGDAERARLVESLTAGPEPRPFPALGQVRLDDALREAAYEPLALSPIARLFQRTGHVLGRVLGARLGTAVNDWERVGPHHAPVLAGRVRQAQAAVGLPALRAYLEPEGTRIELEPGDPDRLRIGVGALLRLDGAALAHQLVRSCELSRSGWAAARLAGPGGLAGLARTVLAALGADVAVPEELRPLVPELTSALAEVEVPSALREDAHAQLEGLDARAFLQAIERSADRMALLACGDASASVRAALLADEQYGEADPALLDAQTIERSEAARAIVLACLRDDVGALRRSCYGAGIQAA